MDYRDKASARSARHRLFQFRNKLCLLSSYSIIVLTDSASRGLQHAKKHKEEYKEKATAGKL